MNAPVQVVSSAELLAHADWLRRLAMSLVRDPERADDLTQETWRRTLERPPQTRDNLRGWLAVAVRHVALEFGRSERARAVRELRASRVRTELSAADVVEQASLQRDLVSCVLELAEPYRSTLLLRYFRDLSPQEIAAELGVPRNTVRSHLARGLAQLRERLDADSGGREAWMRAFAPLLAGSGARVLAWAPVVTGVALALGAVLVALQFVRAPASRAPATSLVASQATVSGSMEAVALPAPARSPAEGRRTPPGSAAPIPSNGGALELRFVDARTGTALADLEFCVFKERDGNALFQRGVTDEHGAATVESLPENVLLIQSARRPPHAIGFAAVWLRRDERRALVIRVGTGGRLTGRAVDERGTPLPGLDVLLPSGACAYRYLPGQSAPDERVARTDAEGRFVVDGLGELPRSVWIVEDEARPETWLPHRVTLASERFSGWSLASAAGVVRAGEELDLVDLVVPRSVTYAGVVLDDERRPVGGALVSLDPHRMGPPGNVGETGQALPGTPGFALEGVEVLSAADGTFRLEAPWGEQPRQFLVWTGTGRHERLAAPRLAPAEVRAGIELTISSKQVLALDLRAPDGTRVDCAAFSPSLRLHGRYSLLPWLGAARVLVASRTDELIELEPHPDADGLLRLSTDLAAQDVCALDVFAPGYRPRHVDLPGGFPAGPLVLDLSPQPRVRVRLERVGGVERPSGETLRVQVGACRAGVESIAIEDRWSRCCGFGCVATVALDDEPVDLDLPVVDDEPYWLTVYASAGRLRIPGRVLGPFTPDSTDRERVPVSVDPAELQPYEPASTAAARKERAPPAPAAPSTARVSDPSRQLGRQLGGLGYLESTEESPTRPGFVARLLEADGTPVAAETDILALDPGQGFKARATRVESDGFVHVEGGLPARFVLVVNAVARFPGSGSRDRGLQCLDVNDWSPGIARDFRLAPWRAIEVVVHGLLDEETVLEAYLRILPPEHVLPRPADGAQIGRDLRESAPNEPRTRRFRLAVAPGSWILGGAVGLLAVPATPIEVRDTESVQRFDMTVRRR